MPSRYRFERLSTPSLPLALLLGLLAVLWLAGGASRADVLGQAVVRGAAWLALIAMALFAPPPALRDIRAPLLLVLAAIGLVLLQLVPLPPAVWLALPGRELLATAATAAGEAQPWRPLAIVPDAAANAASSLIVPLVVLILVASLESREKTSLPTILLGMVAASALFGLMQFSGVALSNPFINDSIGQVSSNFANRNHFALFVAIGCLLVPIWVFHDGRKPRWRGAAGIGLVLIFALVIMASGSRAGILVGLLALGLGGLLARRGLRRELRQAPRWALPAGVALIVATVVVFLLVSLAAGRAVSIERSFASDTSDDLRVRALPTLLSMIQTYFPAGSGFGGFDPLFRRHEPFALLNLAYFNHAHNDFIEILINGGLGALLLLVIALGWWIRASAVAWRSDALIAKLGSAIIFLVLVASAFDYPARTPTMMAVIAVGAAWLSNAAGSSRAPALPADKRSL